MVREDRTDPLPVGGKLTFYQSKWSELLPQFPEIIRKVSQGILIAFSNDAPSLLRHPLELRCNNKTSDLLQALKMLLESRAIEEVSDPSSPGYYSHLFLVPKPGGSFRPIIDLKKLNLYLEVPSFKMETLFSIIAALQPLEWITKIDIKDAYHHILVHQNNRKYFCFVIAGKTYQFRVLPFGLSTTPREFTKNLGPIRTVTQNQRHQSPCLSRRLDNQGGHSRTLYSTYTGDYSTPAFLWMDHKLEEVHSRILTHSRLSGTSLQSRTSHCFSTQLLYRDSPVSYLVCRHRLSCLPAKLPPSTAGFLTMHPLSITDACISVSSSFG